VKKATLYRAVGASDMTTRRQNMPTSQHNLTPEPVEPTCDGPGVHTAQERPIWEVIVEIGAQIPDEVWAAVPDDASINYKHYLYGAPKKQA
jgi:hypothetical protein